jgi:ABC transport system ATP-binding/permease protein
LFQRRALYRLCSAPSNTHNLDMTLITLRDAQLAYSDKPLLDNARLVVRDGERVGLIGRNGTGKSTLLRAIAGLIELDDGELQRRDGLRITFVEQEPELPDAPTLRESLVQRAGRSAPDRLTEFLDRLGLHPEKAPANASGGERKRAALALALSLEPDLLLLDEPTNHLDIEGIEKLEELLKRVPTAMLITHDRAFLDAVTTRIVELDRGVLRSYPGNFAAYEARKVDELASEDAAHRRFDKFWAQEEVWIRKGVEARRTRNEGRVKRLEQLRVDRAARRERIGSVRLSLDSGERSGKLVAELENVTKTFGDRTVIDNLSMRVMRGDRLGIIGPNGAGKSTLIRIILGQLAADSGSVRLGTNLLPAYFDQMREQLDEEKSVVEMISPGSDWVEIGGERKHVVSYLGDFLFSAHRAKSPVKMLSGGERNRLLLARLFARPANLLVLDEPTNDLDIDSLELLEQTLQDYPGTLLLVSHDRRFLDNIVTQVIVSEGGDGTWREYVGGYSDWLAQRPKGRGGSSRSGSDNKQAGGSKQRKKLSYQRQRELEALPSEIEKLEREQSELNARMGGPDYHRGGVEQLKNDRRRAEEIEALLLEKFARWEALEQERSGYQSS